MQLTEKAVLDALRGVAFPGFSRDIVSFGVVGEVKIDGGQVRLRILPGSVEPGVATEIVRAAKLAVEALPGASEVIVSAGAPAAGSPSLNVVGSKPSAARSGGVSDDLLPGVRHIVAVASGKGGVGKSTVAVNLAVALARGGARVGLLDADIYGPSVPLMMGVPDETPKMDSVERKVLPLEREGVRFMSLGLLVERETAVIWRGPMVMKALDDLMRQVAWGDLDILVVDMPPGTGDAQLTMSQRVQLAGAVIVTTPQDVALEDAIKGVAMFRKVEVPVLGLVENMSYFSCPHCSERTEIFGHGGGRREAERLEVPFLGEIPLDPEIRRGGDEGTPVAAGDEDSVQSASFARIAVAVMERLESQAGAAAAGSDSTLFDRFRRSLSRDG